MKAGIARAVVPPWDGRKHAISVAALVVWAYRDQMVHAARPEGMPVEIARDWSPRIAQSAFAADFVESSIKLDFAAAPDAYRVHDAVLRLPVIERQRSEDEIACLMARRLCASELARLGADDARREGRGNATEPDPIETIHLGSLVFTWAMRGCAPDWVADPVYAYERGHAFYRGQRREGVGHQVKPVGDDPLAIEHQRSLYALWAGAMATVRTDLLTRYRLRQFALSVELPPPAPWKSQGTVDMGKKLD
mgnify:CR=1 FL=1